MTTSTTDSPAEPMTYDEAFARLTTEFSMPDLTARNLLLDAFKGQSAWFGGSQSRHRLVHDRGATRDAGYRVLADGYVIPAEAFVAEYRSLPRGGTEYRVVLPPDDPQAIVYVYADETGGLRAESFHGKKLPDVPAAARAAVTAYRATQDTRR